MPYGFLPVFLLLVLLLLPEGDAITQAVCLKRIPFAILVALPAFAWFLPAVSVEGVLFRPWLLAAMLPLLFWLLFHLAVPLKTILLLFPVAGALFMLAPLPRSVTALLCLFLCPLLAPGAGDAVFLALSALLLSEGFQLFAGFSPEFPDAAAFNCFAFVPLLSGFFYALESPERTEFPVRTRAALSFEAGKSNAPRPRKKNRL